jgi:restriction endonuclease Mrr
MIDHQLPKDWKDLQNRAGLILKQAGFEVDVEKSVGTVRGVVEIDIFAIDKMQSPEIIYLCECKYWDVNIPQAQIHAFRTVVADYGANFGIFISKLGFQKGAYEAAEKTNIRLVDWFQFQELFKENGFITSPTIYMK